MKTLYFFVALLALFTSLALSILFYFSGDLDACFGWAVAALYAIGRVCETYKEAA